MLRLPNPDEPIDVEFRVIGESCPIGVLVAETYEPEGPWSPEARIDRYSPETRELTEEVYSPILPA